VVIKEGTVTIEDKITLASAGADARISWEVKTTPYAGRSLLVAYTDFANWCAVDLDDLITIAALRETVERMTSKLLAPR
jgi:hypothetical protein